MTLIQRFGGALNLNVHFHMLFLDGVYVDQPNGSLRFRWVKEPSRAELARLSRTLAERIARYLERQAIARTRLSLAANGNVRYRLKTPYRDGTTHVIFEPLDRDASSSSHGWRHWPYAVRPKPRVNLTRFHGVFARGGLPPNSQHRAVVTRAGRGKRNPLGDAEETPTPAERRASMNWAQRLKRVFNGAAQALILTPALNAAVR